MAEVRPRPDSNGTAPPKAGEPGHRTPKERKLQGSLTAVYEGLGVGIAGLGMQLGDEGIAQMGVKVNGMADVTADAWLELAKENPRVMETLLRLTEASKIGVLVGCHLAMLVPFLIDRGVIPTGVGGIVMAATEQQHAENPEL